MNSALEPRSPRPATAGRPPARAVVLLLVLLALLGMSLDPCASAARGAEPRPAASTPPEPAGEGHHDTAMAAQPASARAGSRAAGPRAGRDRSPSRPPYGGSAAASSGTGPVAAPPVRRVVLRC
ncbi:hypothetical protein OIE71_28275 [Streptomyces sp. NBC_01725]|uniref:hypothetical protein n=1 Tax=Streptomyces sp. NBC_01725 TaxID=2975923 RepID=UPI002E2A25F7|nr:hypothetical protein [Streptomyces sp. NBC_01725]